MLRAATPSMTDPSVIPPGTVAVSDYERLARERLPPAVWAFLASGSADGITLRRNRQAFDDLCLLPRALADMKSATTATHLLGRILDWPVLLAPVALQRLFHPEGERAVAVAAKAAATGMILSTESSVSLEEIAALGHPGPLWFQLYMQADRDFTRELVRRAEQNGYGAIVFTVDAPVSLRNAEERAGFAVPEGIEAVNLRGAVAAPASPVAAGKSPVFSGMLRNAAVWADLEALCAATALPVLAKGIIAPDDAERALAAGVSGIVVSNHGGRALDTAPAAIEVLPAIAEKVGGRVPLIVDGGIRRGTDLLKALALGAEAVLIGRAYAMALAAAGPAGVLHALTILRTEFEAAMALTGCVSPADIGPHLLWNGPASPRR